MSHILARLHLKAKPQFLPQSVAPIRARQPRRVSTLECVDDFSCDIIRFTSQRNHLLASHQNSNIEPLTSNFQFTTLRDYLFGAKLETQFWKERFSTRVRYSFDLFAPTPRAHQRPTLGTALYPPDPRQRGAHRRFDPHNGRRWRGFGCRRL